MNHLIHQVNCPEAMGLSGQAVIRFFEQHHQLGIHSMAVVKNHQVYALSRKPWGENQPHTLFSLSKSFCSMAAGIAIWEGKISPEDLLAEVIPEALPEEYDLRINDIRLKDLLSMSSGLSPKSDQRLHRYRKNWAKEALVHPVIHEPGTVFHYNTLGTYLAGRMVEKRVGMTLRDYLQPRLFEPLGIKKHQWDCCRLGHNLAGIGLHLSCMDIARVAQLLLNQGTWGDRQLLPIEYLRQATAKQVDNCVEEGPNPHPDWLQGYGWQFWMARHGRYRGDGMYGQIMLIDQKNQLALAVTAGENMMGNEMDALHQLMDELMSLPQLDKKGQDALNELKKNLELPIPADSGEALFGEGSYWTRDGRYLRLEIWDEDTLRLMFQGKGQTLVSDFTLNRSHAHHGEYSANVAGERPVAYQGRFGVKDGVITAQAVMPEAPYQLTAQLTLTPEGLQAEFHNIGMDSGKFRFIKAEKY